MDELLNQMSYTPTLTPAHSFLDVFICFILTAILTLPLALHYRKNNKTLDYDQGFFHTLFILSFTTSVIMMIIGSDIARAFSLVGALSIIRFRTAIKDSRNTGYIFAALVIGMGCGTGMYALSISFSIFITMLMLLLNRFEIGSFKNQDQLLNLEVDESLYSQDEIERVLKDQVRYFSLLYTELTNDKGLRKMSYIISVEDFSKLSECLSQIEGVEKVSTFYNDQRINI
ncbi:MAG: hypothetical protein CME65_11465 [Halobacteriovoraceae bacterium]|nr:hypothetical protein [Halobacteriovoraceae bacterium]|tara:strand:- start:19625 stop:20311 length:687 start_codon:yes stop_codon:yes gene_type:complete